MLRYLFYVFGLLVVGWLGLAAGYPGKTPYLIDAESSVQQILRTLGEPMRGDNTARPVEGASAELGQRIVLEGIGQDGKRQSKHFVCSSCHNVVREDANLLDFNPDARLDYAVKNDLPFLAGTTLFGAINRSSYYNDDYEKKYGDLVRSARKDLRSAIQLCATECAQGRPLDEVEMESIVAYLATIGFTLNDLALSEPELKTIADAVAGQGDKKVAIALLKSKYPAYSPATFVTPPEDRKKGYPVKGDAAVGAQVYDRSCLHCHEKQRYSFYELGHNTDSYEHLLKHFSRYTRYSTYQVVRYGTSPIPGKKAYMPHYTAERMSDFQVESLRDFLNAKLAK